MPSPTCILGITKWLSSFVSSCSSPENCSQDAEGTFSSPENTLPRSDVMNGPFTSPHSSLGMPASPAPRTVTDEEMNFVKTCLQRWRSEIEQDIQGWCSENVSATPCLSCLFDCLEASHPGYSCCHCHSHSVVRPGGCDICTSALWAWSCEIIPIKFTTPLPKFLAVLEVLQLWEPLVKSSSVCSSPSLLLLLCCPFEVSELILTSYARSNSEILELIIAVV